MLAYQVYATPPDCEERGIGAFNTLKEAQDAVKGALELYLPDTWICVISKGRVVHQNRDPE